MPSTCGILSRMTATPEYLTAETIAAELGVHPQTVQRYFREGGLPGRKIGKSWTTTREALTAWLTGSKSAPPPAVETPSLPPLETK